jgi:hypothetical protein
LNIEYPGDYEAAESKRYRNGFFEPVSKEAEFFHSQVLTGLKEFKATTDVIGSSSMAKKLADVKIMFIRVMCLARLNRETK